MTTVLQAFLYQQKAFQSTPKRRSLYSDLSRLKKLNPDSYERNVKIWIKFLLEAIEAGYIKTDENIVPWVLDISELVDSLSWVDPYTNVATKPLGIDCVIKEMILQGELNSTQDYIQGKIQILTKKSLYTQVWNQIMKQFVGEEYQLPNLSQTKKFVVTKHLKTLTEAILDYFHKEICIHPCTDMLFTLDDLKEDIFIPVSKKLGKDFNQLDWNCMESEYMDILLSGLRERGVIVRNEPADNLGIIVKFPRPAYLGQYIYSDLSLPNTAIDETDLGILNLKRTNQSLELQIQELEKQVQNYKSESKKYYASGLITQASFALKRHHLIKNTLDKRYKAKTSIMIFIDHLQGAETDYQIHQAYKAGAKALRSMLKDFQLNVDEVDNTMEEIRSALTDISEIQEVINKPLETSKEEDAELEMELEKLIEEESTKEAPVEEVTPPKRILKEEAEANQEVVRELSKLSIVEDEIPPVNDAINRKSTKRAKTSPEKELQLELA